MDTQRIPSSSIKMMESDRTRRLERNSTGATTDASSVCRTTQPGTLQSRRAPAGSVMERTYFSKDHRSSS